MDTLPLMIIQAMLDQRDFTGKAALHHAVADMEERHKVLQALLAAKAQVNLISARSMKQLLPAMGQHISHSSSNFMTVKAPAVRRPMAGDGFIN